MTKTGIEAASFFVPSLYVEIKDLAEQRGIEPAKLEKGLGLKKMAFPDVHEDAATFAAEALLRLIKDYKIFQESIWVPKVLWMPQNLRPLMPCKW
jgi:hydroxymethylglutaryl-CoA synthase